MARREASDGVIAAIRSRKLKNKNLENQADLNEGIFNKNSLIEIDKKLSTRDLKKLHVALNPSALLSQIWEKNPALLAHCFN